MATINVLNSTPQTNTALGTTPTIQGEVSAGVLDTSYTQGAILNENGTSTTSLTVDTTITVDDAALNFGAYVTTAGSTFDLNNAKLTLSGAGGNSSSSQTNTNYKDTVNFGAGTKNEVVLSQHFVSETSVAGEDITWNGVSSGDIFELYSGTFTSATYSGGTLHISSTVGDFEITNITLASGTTGFTIIDGGTELAACYCRGTNILTDAGEVAVEDLKIGDQLITKSGAARAIRWIGRSSYAGRFAASNRAKLPVLIKQGALADNVPARDLYVSPAHAMYLDGVLIPASALVNGSSIVQLASVDLVEYFHVELESHDVIIAEGALSESFVDDDSRNMFHNAAEFRSLYPESVQTPAEFCAPVVEDGEQLESVRAQIAARLIAARRAA